MGTSGDPRSVENDAVRRHEAYSAEGVEMDLTSAYIPDDEFPEEQQVEEAKIPEEIPMRQGWQSCVSTRIWDIPACVETWWSQQDCDQSCE